MNLLFFSILFSLTSQAGAVSPDWLLREVPLATQKILASTSAEGARAGAVIASPSRENPNYFFHWVRDAALTMDTVVTLWKQSSRADERNLYRQKIVSYLQFSRDNQRSETLTGLGEPKFMVDGMPFMGPWGRPQNDGPALRAIAAIHFAQELLKNGEENFVRTEIYDPRLPAVSLTKADLEYVSHHWQEASFDLWEETLGDHFYTRMVQRKALVLGAALADRLQDSGAANWYRQQARAIESSLEAFWDPSRDHLVATLQRKAGIDYKNSGLDIAIILGALHGGLGDGFFDESDQRIQKTLAHLEQQFAAIYPVNHRGYQATALGRYPEDLYSGSDFAAGNPWVLATLAAAELNYRRAALRSCDESQKALLALGDSFTSRVAFHANEDGSLSEQIDRDSGYMVSARDLTWNYAAILTTANSRALNGKCKGL